MPLPGDALLDDAAAEIGIGQPPPHPTGSLAQGGILQSLAVGETGDALVLNVCNPDLEDAGHHDRYYSTK